VSIFAGTTGFLDSVPVEKVTDYEAKMLSFMRSEHAAVLTEIRESKAFENATRDKVAEALDAFAKQYA
jgi:F-type H+-transporting ATPase subunit alpha